MLFTNNNVIMSKELEWSYIVHTLLGSYVENLELGLV